MISPEIVALIASGAGAFVAAWRKFNTSVGSAGGGDSLRDMIVKLDGKLDGMHETLEKKIDVVAARVKELEVAANDNEPTRPDHNVERINNWKRRK